MQGLWHKIRHSQEAQPQPSHPSPAKKVESGPKSPPKEYSKEWFHERYMAFYPHTNNFVCPDEEEGKLLEDAQEELGRLQAAIQHEGEDAKSSVLDKIVATQELENRKRQWNDAQAKLRLRYPKTDDPAKDSPWPYDDVHVRSQEEIQASVHRDRNETPYPVIDSTLANPDVIEMPCPITDTNSPTWGAS